MPASCSAKYDLNDRTQSQVMAEIYVRWHAEAELRHACVDASIVEVFVTCLSRGMMPGWRNWQTR